MGLVPVPQSLEDVDGVGHGGLVDVDRLEPPLQGRVLLQVLAVLVAGRGADRLKLAPGQHGLEDGGGIDSPFCCSRTHQRVQLVDEQHDVAPGLDLLEHLLQALLEVAAVPRAGDQRPQIQRVDLLALQGLGDVTLDDLGGQPLDDGGLAHAGFADQDRVVLRPTGQHLHHPLDLLLPPDHRVQLGLPSELGEVPAELVEHHRSLRALLAGLPLALPGISLKELDDLLPDPIQIRPELLEHLGCHALPLPDEPEEDVLGADVVVPELKGLPERQLQDLLGPGGEGNVPGRRGLSLADDLFHLGPDCFQGDSQGFQSLGRNPFPLVDQPEQDVLGADVVVIEHPRLFLGEDDYPPRSVSEALKHLVPPGPPAWALFTAIPRGSADLVLPSGRKKRPGDACRVQSASRKAIIPAGYDVTPSLESVISTTGFPPFLNPRNSSCTFPLPPTSYSGGGFPGISRPGFCLPLAYVSREAPRLWSGRLASQADTQPPRFACRALPLDP